MVKWKYKGFFIWITIIIFIFSFLSPILRCIASEYPPICWLYYSEGGSFVETQIVPRLPRELVIRSSVDHFKFSKFIIKPMHQQILIFAHIYQAVRSIKFKSRDMSRLDNLRQSNNYLRLSLSLDLRLYVKF